jgi:hypothetical protein
VVPPRRHGTRQGCLGNVQGPRALEATSEDDPLRDAHISIGKAITELKALGVTVPVTLYLAMHALTYARAERNARTPQADDEARR